jgi:hypothetical protein
VVRALNTPKQNLKCFRTFILLFHGDKCSGTLNVAGCNQVILFQTLCIASVMQINEGNWVIDKKIVMLQGGLNKCDNEHVSYKRAHCYITFKAEWSLYVPAALTLSNSCSLYL